MNLYVLGKTTKSKILIIINAQIQMGYYKLIVNKQKHIVQEILQITIFQFQERVAVVKITKFFRI